MILRFKSLTWTSLFDSRLIVQLCTLHGSQASQNTMSQTTFLTFSFNLFLSLFFILVNANYIVPVSQAKSHDTILYFYVSFIF